MSLRSGVKQLLRMCGHAFAGTVHDRLNEVDRQLGQLASQMGDLKALTAQAEFRPMDAEPVQRLDEMEVRYLKGLVVGLGDLKALAAQAEFRPVDSEPVQRLDEMEVRYPKGLVVGSLEEFAAEETRVFTLLSKAGFAPATIFDIGASDGAWSALISNVFPDASFHMFEPLAKLNKSFETGLQRRMQDHPKLTLHEVALGAKCKRATMCIHPDGFSSATLDLAEHPDYQTRRSVPQYTLDQYVGDHNLPLPDLIKLDTQGAEWAILSRSERCLKHAALVIAETWLWRGYGPQTPLITELRDLLESHEFDLAELGYRFYDGNHRLYGCDAFFLKRSFAERVAPAMPIGPW